MVRCGVLVALVTVPAAPSSVAGSSPPPLSQSEILQFLDTVISWHQRQSPDLSVPESPADAAFAIENQPAADQILHLSFDFARAYAKLLPDQTGSAAPDSDYDRLTQAASRLEAESSPMKAEIQSLQQKLSSAPRKQRQVLQSQIALLNSSYQMIQTRLQTLHSILGFAAGTSEAGGLTSHIDALERSFPATNSSNLERSTAAPIAPNQAREPWGIWSALRETLRLSANLRTVGARVRQTDDLIQKTEQLQATVHSQLAEVAKQSDSIISQPNAEDPAIAARQQASLDALTQQLTLLAAAALPLGKEKIVLDAYRKNLANLDEATKKDYLASIKSLVIKLVILAAFLAVVLGLFALWRKAIFRYVTDYRRRYQYLLLRRLVLWFVIVLVIVFSLANQFGSLATFAGLLTAGVAVAMQNVILAVVGYFMLIGKFGVKVGDHVQVSGVTGEVVEIGLIRLHVMELTGTGADAQPTGRIVAFANSIVFQTAAGLFRQVPGTSFVWRETSFTLAAAEGDYREVEKRLTDAVNSVFVELKSEYEKLGQRMEETLGSVAVGPLSPALRFRLTPAGLEVVLRFPVEMRMADEIDNRVTQELLRAINQEPKLKVVAAEIPAIRLKGE